ncbi:c-type cytochrome biogenesis protein CcmI [Thaumasiovibrio subtropicus]|uniref:c-type cytochrome biogenesis protein CcmI n=1 Tax=Thaumasiovibrio subtropicus TaxID=1891207 RepID=UPI000B34BB2A|nr:c-type cytochrome biogenesis protein CcmI [Thaumasiovibrio subtropicus]
MMTFWIASLALVLIVLLSVAIPVYRQKASSAQADRDALNKALYQDRLAELNEENEEGMVADQAAMITELQRTLLDDVPEGSKETETQRGGKAWLWGCSLIAVVASYAIYMQVGGFNAVTTWHETAARLPELSQRLMTEDEQPLSDQELADLTLALRTRLHEKPNDAMGWLLLGRLGMASRDVDMATSSMENALRLAPERFETQFGFTQAMLLSGDSFDSERGRRMLSQLLQSEPHNLQVLSLAAFDAYEQQDFLSAIALWSRMRAQLDVNDPRAVMLDRSIAQAQSSMTGDPVLLSVQVELGEDVVIPTQGALIVTAHTSDGAPMPVAAKRLPLSAFPVTVPLRNSDSMMQGRSLADLDEMLIRVRIDSDGNVGTKENDLFGESLTVSQGDEVKVKIDHHFGS